MKVTKKQLLKALRMLEDATQCQRQGLRLSGEVTPQSPGGQATAIRRNGKPVDRGEFMYEAHKKAVKVLRQAGVKLKVPK